MSPADPPAAGAAGGGAPEGGLPAEPSAAKAGGTRRLVPASQVGGPRQPRRKPGAGAKDLAGEAVTRVTVYLRADQLQRLRERVAELLSQHEHSDVSALVRAAVDLCFPPGGWGQDSRARVWETLDRVLPNAVPRPVKPDESRDIDIPAMPPPPRPSPK